MKKNVNKSAYYLFFVALANLIFSTSLAQSTGITGSQNIGYCVDTDEYYCLNIEIPDSLGLPHDIYPQGAVFLEPAGGRILLIYNYPDIQELIVSDSQDPSSSEGFQVTLDASDLTNARGTSVIPKGAVGVISFNKNTTPPEISTDNYFNYDTITSPVDPTQTCGGCPNLDREKIVETFINNNTALDDWITRFGDSPLPILEYNPLAPRAINIYKMGLAFVIETPASPQEETLIDDQYTLYLTYTLSSS